MSIGFIIPAVWPVALVGLVPFLFVLYKRQQSSRVIFALGILLGFIHNSVVSLWYWHTMPLTWLGIDSQLLAFFVVLVSWVVTAAVLAIAYGIFALSVYKLKGKSISILILIPALWVLMEYMVAWLFSLYVVGGGVLYGAHFSIGFVGYLLANNIILLQAAWLGGVYALGFIIIFVNTFIFYCLKEGKYVCTAIFSAVIMTIIVFGYFNIWQPESDLVAKPLFVTLITTDFQSVLNKSEESKERRFLKRWELVARAAREGKSDVVVLPESDAFIYNVQKHFGKSWQEELKALSNDTIFVSTVSVREAGDLRSKVEYYDTESGISTVGYKQLLLPHGEYEPYFYQFILRLFGAGDVLDKLESKREFTPGKDTALANVHGKQVVSLFCSEVFSPTLYSHAAGKGAEVFINTASHAWFRGSPTVYKQMQNIAKVRAVESRRWYAQATNTAPSFILNQYGLVVAESKKGFDVLHTYAIPQDSQTPYTIIGQWILLLPLWIVIFVLCLCKKCGINFIDGVAFVGNFIKNISIFNSTKKEGIDYEKFFKICTRKCVFDVVNDECDFHNCTCHN